MLLAHTAGLAYNAARITNRQGQAVAEDQMKLVTVQEMQQLEKAADEAGHTYDTMMELAGRAVAELIQRHADVHDKRILILVGPGYNGGDGLVAAR